MKSYAEVIDQQLSEDMTSAEISADVLSNDYNRREVDLAKYGFSDDCEGCRMAQVAAGAKSHSEVCCERIRQVMMNDDVGSRGCMRRSSESCREENYSLWQ